jgi:alkylation response protein AidB-like acyl-CoA dehydrogenase
LSRTVRRWLDTHCEPKVVRAAVDADEEELQSVWPEFAAQGWLGIHVPERWGGQGFGLLELAVVLEETGRSLLPGPLLPTVVASSVIAEAGTDGQCSALLPGLVDGSVTAAVSLGPAHLHVLDRIEGGAIRVSGTVRPVLGAVTASVVLVPVRQDDDQPIWCAIDAEQLRVQELASLDPTRRVGTVEADAVTVGVERQFPGLTGDRIREMAVSLAAAEEAGGARWCLDTASEYAKVRRQFGRPIGQFQAVKHRLANMLVTVEEITALSWDAALAVTSGASDESALAVAIAGAIVFDGYAQAAKDCVQLLGGIGFTWEHDAHLHLRRAMTTRQLVGESDRYQSDVVDLARRGVRRTLVADLPSESELVRAQLAPVVEGLTALEGEDRRRAVVEAGLAVPHWPSPWGRDASAVEQLVIDEEMAAAGISRPHLAVGAWALPAIIAHGSEEQCQRWVLPTLLGELSWCQLFSEPGAGSDLASLTTRAERADGGWRLTGQKVWTSLAVQSDWGICLARTNPSAPKHQGITYFLVDMASPGLDIRPLRELTGDAMFNEVFLDDVFVPDQCVVGEVDRGWEIARLTLANERVSMSSGATFGIGVEALLHMADHGDEPLTPGMALRLGALLAEAQAIRLMGHRSTLRSLAGADPGTGTSAQKLLGAEHEQRAQELGLAMLGAEGATTEGDARRWTYGFLVTRCLTIAGGTSEIQRNVIAERLLGLPRDPEPAS